MTTFFSSRHQGAIDWIKQQRMIIDRFVTHLDIDDVQPGDRVIGTLPIPMVAALTKKGATYLHLNLVMPANLRGLELAEEKLYELGASLQAYRVVEDE